MKRAAKEIFNTTDKSKLYFFCTLLIAFILKYLIYGFNCFYVLDDYIQYGGYPMYNDVSYVLFNIGTIVTRPLASILDVVFWGKLWDAPHLMFVISCTFHFLSCVVFYKTAEENKIYLSPLFAVFYLFFPLGSEGSMWISASSRIIVGLFFTSFALYFLTKYEKFGKVKFFLFFLLFSICSFTIYEACAVFCFVTSVFILINNRQNKRVVFPLISLFVMLFCLLLYMKLCENIGHMGSRSTQSSFLLIFTQFKDFLNQLFEIMTSGIFRLTTCGFSKGLGVLFGKGICGILYLFVIFAVCVLFGYLFSISKERLPQKSNTKYLVLIGMVIFSSAFAPNMITEPVWITYRTMFIAMIGIYLICDVLFSKIANKSLKTIILMVLLFIFTISSINEYDTYKRTHELDITLLNEICETLPDDVLCGEKETAILLDEVPRALQVSYYKDHVKTVFHHDWSLTGAVRAYTRNIRIKKVTPVYPDTDFDYSDCYVIDLRTKK
ncbi:MAG: glucosyltransferase domain-containing protein [Clostridia bacterium]|nr:glucosyltransferase domain-containing protein [Clostridia bacterium]